MYKFGVFNNYEIIFQPHRSVLYKNGKATDVVNVNPYSSDKQQIIDNFKSLVRQRLINKILLIS